MLLVTLVICIESLCGQYTVTTDPQTALTIDIHMNAVICKLLNEIQLSRLT